MGNEISAKRIKQIQEHKPSQLDKKAAKSAFAKGNAFVRQKRFMDAISEFTKAIALCPGMVTIYRERSRCFLMAKRHKQALNDGLLCSRLAPDWAKGDLCVAMALFAMDLPKQAAKAVAAGLKIDPNDEALKMMAVECPKRQKELEQTATTGNVADWEKKQISTMGKDERELRTNALKESGNAKFKNGFYDHAIHDYSLAIKMCPGDHLLYSNRSAAFLKLERLDKALYDGQKCIELQPAWIKGYFRTMNVLLKLGKDAEARKLFEQAHPMVGGDAMWSSLEKIVEKSGKSKNKPPKIRRDIVRYSIPILLVIFAIIVYYYVS